MVDIFYPTPESAISQETQLSSEEVRMIDRSISILRENLPEFQEDADAFADRRFSAQEQILDIGSRCLPLLHKRLLTSLSIDDHQLFAQFASATATSRDLPLLLQTVSELNNENSEETETRLLLYGTIGRTLLELRQDEGTQGALHIRTAAANKLITMRDNAHSWKERKNISDVIAATGTNEALHYMKNHLNDTEHAGRLTDIFLHPEEQREQFSRYRFPTIEDLHDDIRLNREALKAQRIRDYGYDPYDPEDEQRATEDDEARQRQDYQDFIARLQRKREEREEQEALTVTEDEPDDADTEETESSAVEEPISELV